ncbi:MAG: hypothetical protein LBV38_05695 [Alistipes sp.]|jgi:hypothetical protein|nr:hypothetical protein [Alistipes sp.]
MNKTIRFFGALAAGMAVVTAGILLTKGMLSPEGVVEAAGAGIAEGTEPPEGIRLLSQLFYTLYYFIPAIAVLVAEREGFGAMLRKYRVGFREIDWRRALTFVLATALVLPLLHTLCVWAAGNLLHIEQFGRVAIPSGEYDLFGIAMSDNMLVRGLSIYIRGVAFALLAGLTFNMLFALGGEVGWRGFLGRHLSMSPAKRDIATGLIWGTWHLPIALIGRVGAMPAIEIVGAVGATYINFVILSFLLDMALERGRSLFVPAAVYGVYISSSLTSLLDIHSQAPLAGTNSVVGVVSLAILYALLRCCYTSRRTISSELPGR